MKIKLLSLSILLTFSIFGSDEKKTKLDPIAEDIELSTEERQALDKNGSLWIKQDGTSQLILHENLLPLYLANQAIEYELAGIKRCLNRFLNVVCPCFNKNKDKKA